MEAVCGSFFRGLGQVCRIGCQWGKLTGDVPAAAAMLDRFLQAAKVVEITGRSNCLRNVGRSNKDVSEPDGRKHFNDKSPRRDAKARPSVQEAKHRHSLFPRMKGSDVRNPLVWDPPAPLPLRAVCCVLTGA